MDNTLPLFTEEQKHEIIRYRQSFPYRIVFFAQRGTEWFVSAVPTMRIPNKLVREGYSVVTCK